MFVETLVLKASQYFSIHEAIESKIKFIYTPFNAQRLGTI
jgi:hypothetical protein